MSSRTSRQFRRRIAALSVIAACALGVQAGEGIAAENVLIYRGADREKVLLEGARREGQVALYSAMIVNQALRPIADAFGRKYPFVRITYWRNNPQEIVARSTAERTASNMVGDVLEGTGLGEMAVQAGLAQPFASPMVDEFPAEYRDPAGLWAPVRFSYFATAYNTRLIPPQDAPKTFEDLLDPKWKGKIAWRVGEATGTPLFITNLRIARGEQKAMDYLRKLAQNRIINFGSGSTRTLVDRVVAGEYPIAIQIFAHHPIISKLKGAPVDTILMPPVASAASTIVVPKGVKNPHAAMLLVDFILSREGQQILSKASYFPARSDVRPGETVAGVVPKIAGVAENFISPDAFLKYTESSEKIYQELFR